MKYVLKHSLLCALDFWKAACVTGSAIAACGNEMKLMKTLQTQTYTNIFWVFIACQRTKYRCHNKNFKKFSSAEEHKYVKPLHLYEVSSDTLLLLVKIESCSDDVLNTVMWNEYLLHMLQVVIYWGLTDPLNIPDFLLQNVVHSSLGLIMPASSPMRWKKYWKACLLAAF